MLSTLTIAALTYLGLAALIFAAAHDISFRTVPNFVWVTLLLAGIALRVADHNLPAALAVGLAVFALLYIVWRLGLMGGGDLKMLTAASVFTTPWHVPDMLAVTALAGGVLALIYFVAGYVVPRPAGGRPRQFIARIARCERWRLHRRGPLPYAVAIAAGGAMATLAS